MSGGLAGISCKGVQSADSCTKPGQRALVLDCSGLFGTILPEIHTHTHKHTHTNMDVHTHASTYSNPISIMFQASCLLVEILRARPTSVRVVVWEEGRKKGRERESLKLNS